MKMARGAPAYRPTPGGVRKMKENEEKKEEEKK
jgi:hypothetical protein